MEQFRWGYDLHSVTIGLDKSVVAVAEKEIHTCVAEGVLVESERGPVAIETLAIGDRILGYDLDAGERVPVTVRDIRVSVADAVLQIGELLVTGNHPVYVDGRWRAASVVQPGSRLIGADGESFAATRVSHVAGPQTVYSLTVDGPTTTMQAACWCITRIAATGPIWMIHGCSCGPTIRGGELGANRP